MEFPVWRELKHQEEAQQGLAVACHVWMEFPVWRELKPFTGGLLKGRTPWVWMEFPVWRELKLKIAYFFLRRQGRLDGVSRLKGIETHTRLWATRKLGSVWMEFPVWRELKPNTPTLWCTNSPKFGWSFPFEGNWNLSRILLKRARWCPVWMEFPVWRELKRPSGSHPGLFWTPVWMEFPVWRELKLKIAYFFLRRQGRLDGVSRLKGIETHTRLWATRKLGSVWMEFPVWRELKPNTPTLWCTNSPKFGWSFPFEGNWNVR